MGYDCFISFKQTQQQCSSSDRWSLHIPLATSAHRALYHLLFLCPNPCRGLGVLSAWLEGAQASPSQCSKGPPPPPWGPSAAFKTLWGFLLFIKPLRPVEPRKMKLGLVYVWLPRCSQSFQRGWGHEISSRSRLCCVLSLSFHLNLLISVSGPYFVIVRSEG